MKLAPSILSADFGRLREESAAVAAAGADWLHVDVMDGHFVPNITIGPCVVRSLRPAVHLFFDVHLMISDPLSYVRPFAEAGADLICFHYEADYNVDRVLDEISACGKHAGLAIKPKTPVEALFPYLERLDLALIMTVEPGFGGQSFMHDQLEKVRVLRGEAVRRGTPLLIEVDGGVNAETIGACAACGVDVAVAGSAIYGKPDYAAAIQSLRQACSTPQQ